MKTDRPPGIFRVAALAAAAWLTASLSAAEPYAGWRHSGTLNLLTTPEGAHLPAGAAVTNFPVLIRLHPDWFDFRQAAPDGADLRFSAADGTPLGYQIEEWDPARGSATIWVRVPLIRGNERQELRLHWGRPDAVSESRGTAVFDASNGYLSVWHMNSPVRDDAGTLESKDTGTTPTAGVMGPARHLAGRQGIFGGDRITNYPSGSASHSSEAWFRAQKPNGRPLAWGNEHGQGKVVMHHQSPPHVRMECYFSGADLRGRQPVPLGQWVHVLHSYEKGNSRLYVNGVLDVVSTNPGSPLAIKSPARLWIGGWYHNYDFTGDIDEVRVSSVARSADWVRLQYENQKPLQTLAGPLVQPGDAFSVTPAQAVVAEGRTVTLSAEAGGARKLYWVLRRDGRETVVAVDRWQYTFEAGRVAGDEQFTIQLRAVTPAGIRTRDVPVTIREALPEPVFTLDAPATWDGRSPVTVTPRLANLAELRAAAVGEVHTTWRIADLAVIRDESTPGSLVLQRAQNSGPLTVTAILHNGGRASTQSVTITVTEPARDPWIARTPARDEKPVDHQFYARDDRGEGTLFHNGTLDRPADAVFLRLYADGKLERTETRPLGADRSYAFSLKLRPGLIRYSVEFGAVTGGAETVLHTATNLVCGDAFIIQGQSNAVATDWGPGEPTLHSEWIRSYGTMSGDPRGVRVWGEARQRNRDGEKLQIGYWGMELAARLVASNRVPICILNGAVGGTRIDQHQRNPADPTDPTTIYGRLLARARQAGLTHGIRGILWHQGENDQGADGPTGGYGWETYRQYFIDLAAAWKQDYPNVQHYYVFQIWPKACAMGVDGSDNRLREVQRNLPTAFSRLGILSTLGIDPPGGCHYPAAGYAEFARLIFPLIQRDHYGATFATPITPPNLRRAAWGTAARDELVLEFDQPVRWEDTLSGQFHLDGVKGRVAGGSAADHVIRLRLAGPSTARTITYLDSKSWSPKTVLRGANGIAALTFCEVPIAAP